MLKKISIIFFIILGMISSVEAMMVPDAPTGLSAVVAGSGELSLLWTAGFDGGDPLTDYIIEYKKTGEVVWNIFADPIDTLTTGLVTGLIDTNTYNIRVSAVNIHGTGPSVETTGTPLDPIPTAPTVSVLSLDSILALNGFALNASYTFLDVNGDSDLSTIVWSRATDVVGPYVAIPGATTLSYTPMIDDIGYYLRLEVLPETDVAPTTGVLTISSATVMVAEPDYVNHILSAGQSLAIGTKAIPPVSTTQPYSNLMLDGHPSSGWGAGTNLVPLVEAHWETPGSGMANTISSLRADTDIAIGLHGYNAVHYGQIKQGTGLYNKGQLQMTNTKAAAELLNRPYKTIAVTLIHGETDDFINTSGATYKGYLEELQTDYQSDIHAATGQTHTIPLFTDQESSFTSSYYVNKETSEIPLAQLQAAVDNPGEIVLVGPKYFFDYNPTDGTHLTPEDSRLLGEYYGKVINHVVFDGQDWTPLMPKELGLRDTILYVDYHVPAGVLEIDTSLVAARTNYGFEFYDNEGSTVINTVEVMDADTLKITLSQEPLGSDMKLRYAYRGVPGTYGNRFDPNAVGGNIRDTDTTLGNSGIRLYNWAVQGEWDIDILPEIVVTTGKSGSRRRDPSRITETISQEDTSEEGVLVVESIEQNTCRSFTRNIHNGDRDGVYSSWSKGVVSHIVEFQKYLNDSGFAAGVADGIYGPITRSAVQQLQTTLGVIADGIYGPITIQALILNC